MKLSYIEHEHYTKAMIARTDFISNFLYRNIFVWFGEVKSALDGTSTDRDLFVWNGKAIR